MDLYLVRHAIAGAAGPGQADAARTLTDEGRARMERAVRGLGRLGVAFDLLRHSPWTRAVETADLLMPLCQGESVVEPLLAAPPGAALVAALAAGAQQRVALVGHQPWLGELAGLLLFASKAPGDRLSWRKGAVAHLVGEPRAGAMVLAAFWPPRALRRIR
jgi:phosphohistidine phosphatase